jgi:glycosyltransferase involved in cell wall biosynthesis
MTTLMAAAQPAWHFLDGRCVWVREVAAVASRVSPVRIWLPRLSWAGRLRTHEAELWLEPGVPAREFPLQRGFARWPLARLVHESARIARRLQTADPEPRAVLVLCSPHYCDVARAWPGPRIYYATDMFRFCGDSRPAVERMERIMCRGVDLVCPNSRRIADHMVEALGVPRDKILVVPNAARAANLLQEAPSGPHPLPADVSDLPRPVAGVIGNLSSNTDWVLLEEAIARTSWLSWLFVGPSGVRIPDARQQAARARVMAVGGRVRFAGERPYGVLVDYARAFDVAVLPYRAQEPTRSGSSTRFYEHLAAARPMIATRGVDELLDKAPLVRLVDTASEMVASLERLRDGGFHDGYEGHRWLASRNETIEARVASMRAALSARGLLPGEDEHALVDSA